LRVFIPSGASAGPEKSTSQTSIYYHSCPQPSPDCQSRSSLSSVDANNSPLPPPASPVPNSTAQAANSPTTQQTGTSSGQIHPTPATVGKPIVIK
jgi:hypothetical protein